MAATGNLNLKAIGQLGQTLELDDDSLLIVEQNGTAFSVSGQTLKEYIANRFATQYANLDNAVEAAANSATDSANSAANAASAVAQAVVQATQAYTAAKEQAEIATEAAEDAIDAAASATATVGGIFYYGDDGYVYQDTGDE